MPWSDRDIELTIISDLVAAWRRLWELADDTQRELPTDVQEAAEASPRDVSSSLTRLVPTMATFHPDVIATVRHRLQGMADFIDDLATNGGGRPTSTVAAEARSSSRQHRVVVIDETRAVSRGLELLLRYVSSEQVELVSSSEDPDDTVPLILRDRPDVLVLRLERVDATRTCLAGVRERFDTDVVVLLDNEDMAATWQLVDEGAAAVVPASTPAAGLLVPILGCDVGLHVVPRDAATAAGRLLGRGAPSVGELTEDEIALWDAVARGRSDQAIAEELHLSGCTAKRRVAALLRRVGASNRIHAAALAGQHGLLDR